MNFIRNSYTVGNVYRIGKKFSFACKNSSFKHVYEKLCVGKHVIRKSSCGKLPMLQYINKIAIRKN